MVYWEEIQVCAETEMHFAITVAGSVQLSRCGNTGTIAMFLGAGRVQCSGCHHGRLQFFILVSNPSSIQQGCGDFQAAWGGTCLAAVCMCFSSLVRSLSQNIWLLFSGFLIDRFADACSIYV